MYRKAVFQALDIWQGESWDRVAAECGRSERSVCTRGNDLCCAALAVV